LFFSKCSVKSNNYFNKSYSLFYFKKDTTNALKYIDSALLSDKKNQKAIFLKSIILNSLELYEESNVLLLDLNEKKIPDSIRYLISQNYFSLSAKSREMNTSENEEIDYLNKAKDYINDLISSNPRNYKYFKMQIKILNNLGEYQIGLKKIEEFSKTYVDSTYEIYSLRGSLKQNLDDQLGAKNDLMIYLKHCKDIDKLSNTYFFLGNSYDGLLQYDSALYFYDKQIENNKRLNIKDYRPFNAKAYIYIKLNDHKKYCICLYNSYENGNLNDLKVYNSACK
jgi:tetratricopeptide (TPR) repeat protein